MKNSKGFILVFLPLLSGVSISIAMEKPPHNNTFRFDQKESACCICTEDFKNNEKYTELPCNHVLHFGCYQKLEKTLHGNSCPLCRGEIPYQIRRALAQKHSGTFTDSEDNNSTTGLFKFLKPSWWTTKDTKKSDKKDSEELQKAQREISQLQIALNQRSGALNDLNLRHQQLLVKNSQLEIVLKNYQEALEKQVDSHHKWRKRLLTCSSLALGACSGFITYKYLTDNSKTFGISAGLGSWAIFEYIGKRQLTKWHTQEHAEVKRLLQSRP